RIRHVVQTVYFTLGKGRSFPKTSKIQEQSLLEKNFCWNAIGHGEDPSGCRVVNKPQTQSGSFERDVCLRWRFVRPCVVCGGDMQPGAAPLHSGLLTAAVLLGACLGLVAATLIHIYILKPLFFSRKFKGYDPWSLLEVEERDEETEGGSVGRKTVPSETVVPSDLYEHTGVWTAARWARSDSRQKQTDPVSSDVAAFALKAKVVYPINQRYRPLADGASNPSLHENPKPVVPPDQNSGSSSADDWQSQEREEDESSQDIFSGLAPKTQESLSFRREQHHPHTLCYPGDGGSRRAVLEARRARGTARLFTIAIRDEAKVSLLCVTLQNLYQHSAQLQQEKWSIFLHILRVLFSRESHALHQDLQRQEKEIEQLKKDTCPELLAWEKGAEPGSVFCFVEDVEKAGREKLEHALRTAMNFAKRLEQLCQHLHSSTSNDVAQETTRSLTRCLLLVEKQLVDVQSSLMKTLRDRMQWWEEMSGWLRIRTALLRQEAELKVKLTTQSLEVLTADGQLGFGHMERLISDLQSTVREELQRCSEEVCQQTVELVCVHCKKLDVKMRKMRKAQVKEWNHMLKSHDPQEVDAQQVTELLVELQVKHWKQRTDYELQHDRRVSDAVCELWMKLFQVSSGSITGLWRDCVQTTLTISSALSVDDGRMLLDNTELALASQIQQQESNTPVQHLQTLRDQLDRDRKVWTEEEVLADSCLKHLADQHMRVTRVTVGRQNDIQDRLYMWWSCISLQQEHLSELETASELMQEHTQFLIGHALANSARLRSGDSAPDTTETANDGQKERLKEAVCESVYVTQDSVTALILNYYSQIQTVLMATQLGPQQQHTKIREKQRKRGECIRALQRELSNWTRKPHSAEFYKRVEQQKRRCLSQCEEEGIPQDRGEMMGLQHQKHTIREELRRDGESGGVVVTSGIQIVSSGAEGACVGWRSREFP
ncbi:hypothetical protein NFI96_026574, partial [Prochilodus magdalenae]